MPKYIDVDSSAYDYGTLADWLISSVGPEPPVWTEAHIEELIEDFYVVPKSTPLADVVEVRHGHWVWKHRHRGGVRYMTGEDEYGNVRTIQVNMTYECDDPYCSECGKLCDNSGSLNFCPHCGCIMDGGQDDD